ncbi:MAG TPA: hypothetical protein VFI65_19375 [Streptosporangiaceae bacterium]|nr:hypothetical protein [Streptosporangiaceae bacterium]
MRVMAKISIPVESGNRAIVNGALPSVIQRTAERWHPEAMYFAAFDGRRTAYLVFDLPGPQDLPPFAEPFFTELNAEVEVAPVMDSADLQKGLAQLS